ncbi:hypothetical protein NA57DRAFT_56209 [Rhizodiscina lignyota]|uniref:DUF3074 domain-containing protein n=1 Tax=Rhizodiscina lignyota TaxID=1504668 RepID=A0A9P4ICY7_9PEZI|nr:hypothetical protein NA57DRAFT_56209 [Rhizodiscina lignyota]
MSHKEPDPSEVPVKYGTERRLFTLRILRPHEVPQHPALPLQPNAPDMPQPDIKSFINTALSESLGFIDETWPVLASKGEKASPPSKAKVALFGKDINNPHGAPECWFARRSIHEGRKEEGTADWGEFVSGLFDGHSVNEKEYTPDVFDARKILDWGEDVGKAFEGDEQWAEVSMCAYEMAHKIPVLSNRVFPELIIAAKYKPHTPHHSAFVFVQIPLNLETSPDAFYSNGSNKTKGEGLQKKDVVLGRYVSMERCIERADGKISWEMATASDAAGALPMPLQKFGVPAAVVKDVGLFLSWTAKRRGP